MTEHKVSEFFIDCRGDPRGYHEKLPCAECGRHAGGCSVGVLVPHAKCRTCGGPLCMDCEHLEERRAVHENPPRCRTCRHQKKASDEWARREYGQRRFVSGVIVGISMGGVIAGVVILGLRAMGLIA